MVKHQGTFYYRHNRFLLETSGVCWVFSILVVGTLLIATRSGAAFLPQYHSSVGHILSISSSSSLPSSSSRQRKIDPLFASSTANSISSISSPPDAAPTRPLCFYRGPGKQWRPRIELADLRIGQELQVTEIIQELLNGRTGPKLYCEVGAGRYSKGKWNMVFAMLRLPRDKTSVTAKRAARLRKKCNNNHKAIATTTIGTTTTTAKNAKFKKTSKSSSSSSTSSSSSSFPVYVSRIRVDNGQLEVCLTREEALAAMGQSSSTTTTSSSHNIRMSSLKVGQELTGRVVRVEPYGVLIHLDNVNRPGLLHIQKVAALYGSYIDKEKGLQQQAGLERGTRLQVQVAVAPVRQKRLSLDFTQRTKAMAAEQEQQRQSSSNNISSPQQTAKIEASTVNNKSESATTSTPTAFDTVMSADELTAWAAYAEQSSSQIGSAVEQDDGDGDDDDEEEDDDDEDDDYDEDRDIEDALGLGSY